MTIRPLIFVVWLSVVPAFGDDPDPANRLMVEAIGLVRATNEVWAENPWAEDLSLDAALSPEYMQSQTFRIPKTPEQEQTARLHEEAYRKALDLNKRALALLQKIVTKYPSSSSAKMLITGQAIENVSFTALRWKAIQLQEVLSLLQQGLAQARTVRDVCFSSPTVNCLLALELHEADKIEDEGRRKSALAQIAELQAELGDVAGALQTAKKTYHTISSQARALASVVKAQAESGDIDGAFLTVREWGHVRSKALALVSIGQVQAESGDRAAAVETFAAAVQMVWDIRYPDYNDYEFRVSLIAEIARVQAETGDIDGAFHTAITVRDAPSRTHVLASIAKSQPRSDDITGAFQITDVLQMDMDNDYQGFYRAQALAYVAEVQAKWGNQGIADETFSTALQTAREIEHARYRRDILESIAQAQANSGDIEGALQTVEEIDDGTYRGVALAYVAQAQANSGDIEGALQTVEEIDDGTHRGVALAYVAQAQAKSGDIDGALQTVRKLEDQHFLSSSLFIALASVAKAQVDWGDIAGAVQTAETLHTFAPWYYREVLVYLAKALAEVRRR